MDIIGYIIFVIFVIIIAILSVNIGIQLERRNQVKSETEEKHLKEIKKLLREHKSLKAIRNKIQKWKKEGYNVDNLEKLIGEA